MRIMTGKRAYLIHVINFQYNELCLILLYTISKKYLLYIFSRIKIFNCKTITRNFGIHILRSIKFNYDL